MCNELMLRCRLQDNMLPCSHLFQKQLIAWAGACCVMSSKTGTEITKTTSRSKISLNTILDVVLKNVHGNDSYYYQFFSKYSSEDASAVSTHPIDRGRYYIAQLKFTSVQDKDADRLVTGSCVADQGYSRTKCQMNCREQVCGCSDPMHTEQSINDGLPTCSVTQMPCHATVKLGQDMCDCKPACKFVSSNIALRALALRDTKYTFDSLFADVNYSASVVLSLRVTIGQSKIFNRMSTETWFTLLCTLVASYNMLIFLSSIVGWRFQHVPRRGPIQRTGTILFFNCQTASIYSKIIKNGQLCYNSTC
ncbi:uncharacterized protein LOC113235487 isoform X2 [Hyposmocoma kahamanoa]|uniref:uncharacterized protein LOC113235487 isoform X2 n=1 Tax=Hyposmocoma kahamanoa TaxID=1477025 RepID=UPI000E6D7B39|nr:uncharacterized protein LOC113235487 isoform X2 [Hyposmocoma kahamanoa]